MLIPKPLQEWTQKWIASQRLSTEFSILPLAGDGSTRQFFRLSVTKDKKPVHFILLHDPSWTLSQDYPSHQSYLKSVSIPVPDFTAIDKKAGVLLMQDLGDELLQLRIEKEPAQKKSWLEKSIRLLAHLHGQTFPVPPSIPASTRRFDAKKYFDELSYTLEHLHERLLGLEKLGPPQLSKVQTFCQRLEEISPEVFCHRDYHCRNLLVHNNDLYMIDFQDARLGSPQYDIASLVYDAYVPITETERAHLLSIYKKEIETFALYEAIDWKNFEHGLSLVGLQRTIKAAGSFASFYTRNQKSTHLKYLVPALKYSIHLKSQIPVETASLMNALPLEKWIERFETLRLI